MLFLMSVPTARADGGGAFELLEKKADATYGLDHYEGWGYLVSGGVALAISIPAYYLTDDVFAKAVYSVTETLGVAAVGYGSYLVIVDNEMSRFVRIIKSVPKLTHAQENQLAASYLRENADRARGVRKIRVISHALTAALNFVNAATSSNQNLAEALYFVGGVNTLAALGFAISRSEDEKAVDALPAAHASTTSFEFFAGPVSGLAIRF
jgi:hypothetical protein